MSNVLLRANQDRVEMATTDLDVSVTCAVEAKVSVPGATTVPVKKLFGIVRELPMPEIEIHSDDRHSCTLQSGGSFYKLHGLPAEEFPALPQFAQERRIVLPQEKVKSMLRRTAFAMSTEEARYVLNGIFFSVREHKITMVATDGRRLALAEEEIDVPVESLSEFIVPAKAINELNRLMQSTGQVEIRSTANQAAFTLQDEKGFSVLLITKLVEGNYPNYRQVVPTESKERLTVMREELLQALHRAEFMTSEKVNSVKFNFSKNNLAITVNSPELGEARESLAINYPGRDLAIAFNPTYMMDPLKVLDNDEVALELTDELSPAVMKINGPYLYVLMPMRTN